MLGNNKFGPISVDETGIRCQRKWIFFGEQFDLAWQDITRWSVTEVVLASGSSTRVFARELDLHTANANHHIKWSGSLETFTGLVDYVRSRLPEKETESPLVKYGNMLRSSNDVRK